MIVLRDKVEVAIKLVFGPPHETAHYLAARAVGLKVKWHYAHVMINCKDVVPFPRWQLLVVMIAPLLISVALLGAMLYTGSGLYSPQVLLMLVCVFGCEDDALRSLAVILGHVYDEEGNKLV